MHYSPRINQLIEDNQTFAEFLWGAIREHFGVAYRAPMPDPFPVAGGWDKTLALELEEHARLLAMTPKQQIAWGKKARAAMVEYAEAELLRRQSEIAKVQAILAEWDALPDDAVYRHAEGYLIGQSIETDLQSALAYNATDDLEASVAHSKALDPMTLYRARLDALTASLPATEARAERAQEEADRRTRWLRELRAIVPEPGADSGGAEGGNP